jgi:hypothetical protein
VEVAGAGLCVVVEAGLVGGVGLELALHAAHAGEHGVEVAEDVVRLGEAGDGDGGGILEERLHGRGVLLDGEVCGAEVLAEELVGEAEEGLVLRFEDWRLN